MSALEFNLLPEEFRRPEKVVRLKVWGVLLGLVAIVLVVFLLLVYTGQTRRLNDLAGKVRETNDEISRLRESVRLTEEVDKLKEGLSENIDAINDLANQNVDRVQLLQEINMCVPPNMSLVSLEQRNNTYLITGYAMSNLTVARFMDRLKTSEQFQRVALTFIKPSTVEDEDVLSFEVSGTARTSSTVSGGL